MDVNIVQFDIAWANPALNFKKVEALCHENPPAAGGLLVLPEMFATGFCMDAQLAAAAEGEIVDFVKSLARKYQCYVIAGVVIAGTNCALCMSPAGDELACYAKRKLFTPGCEGDVFMPGSQAVVFDINGINFSMHVCYDLRFPELFREAAIGGAEAFVVIASWPGSRREHWATLLKARAIENQACVIASNRIGSDPNTTYTGDSCAIDAYGNVQVEMADREGILCCEIDIDSLRQWRQNFPALKDCDSI